MVELQPETDGRILTVKLSGKLTKEDYAKFVPEVERLIKNRGKVRILCQMHDFHGWQMGALWEDIKFDVKHFADVERWRWSAIASGSTAWPSSASRSRRPRSATSTSMKRTRPASGSMPTCPARLPVPNWGGFVGTVR